MTDTIQLITTMAERAEADKIAQTLVERRLAACVQIVGPITSTYRWEDRVETTEEWQCVVKTTLRMYPAVEQAIRELHSYKVPEILAVPVAVGSRAYLDWLRGELPA